MGEAWRGHGKQGRVSGVSSGSDVGAGNFSGKTGLIAVKWKSWGDFGIREKVCGTQEIGMGYYVCGCGCVLVFLV